MDGGSEDKNAKIDNKCVIKKLKFKNYKNSLEATQLEDKISHLERNEIDNKQSLKKIIKNSYKTINWN